MEYIMCKSSYFEVVSMSALIQQAPEPAAVLAKALLNAAEQLGLKQADLGAILGLDRY
jgi:hypothetical protein